MQESTPWSLCNEVTIKIKDQLSVCVYYDHDTLDILQSNHNIEKNTFNQLTSIVK